MHRLAVSVVAAVLYLSCSFATARSNDVSDADPALDQQIASLRSAKSCDAADAKFQKILWGSTKDVLLGETVIAKCERGFLAKLSPTERENYQLQMKRCHYIFEGTQGSLFLSEEALCQATVAKSFAHSVKSALDFRRASFDCAKASTALENLICSNKQLGQADIILTEGYRSTLRDDGVDRPALIKNERRWLASLTPLCGVGPAPTQKAAACVTYAFEKRFAAFNGCGITSDWAVCLDGLNHPEAN